MVHLFRHSYWETSGRSLDQEGVYVTSRSGALTKLIIWGHLLASDPDFYDDKTFPSLWCVKLYDRMFLLRWCRQVLLTQFHWVCRVSDFEDAEASVEPPWTLDWVRECAIWVDSFTVILLCFDDMILILWYVVDVLTRWLMMHADDSLSTRLTYGVKGPHMISREVEGEVWIAALP